MACSTCGGTRTSDIKYELHATDGTVTLHDTRRDAQAARTHGGKIKPVRVPS